jgi:Fic family protein
VLNTDKTVATFTMPNADVTVTATFAIASNRAEMSRRAKDGESFLDILRELHRVIMSGRPSSRPGMFKTRGNRAGETHFVQVDCVRGTLKRGFEMARSLRHPFARALFMLFMTSEVHPFEDGNGRISRLMMNAELVSAGESKVLVPTVYRQDYIGALRRLSRNGDPDVLISAMNRLRDFSRRLACGSFEVAKRQLEGASAFSDDDGKILRF